MASDSDFPETDSRLDPKFMTVEELLTWTYRDQRAHWYVRGAYDWFLLDVAVSGAAGEDAPRPPIDRDAAAVHAVVMGLHPSHAALVIRYAQIGDEPQPSDSTSRPFPTTPEEDDSYRRGIYEGHRVAYKVAIAERVCLIEPIYEMRNRKKMVQVGSTRKIEEVEYCPLDWQPSPEWIRWINHEADVWRRSLALIAEGLSGVELWRHRLAPSERAA